MIDAFANTLPGFDEPLAMLRACHDRIRRQLSVLERLRRHLPEYGCDADARKALTDLGVDVVGNTPEELRAYVKSEIPKWAAIVKVSGAKLE